LIRCLPVLESR